MIEEEGKMCLWWIWRWLIEEEDDSGDGILRGRRRIWWNLKRKRIGEGGGTRDGRRWAQGGGGDGAQVEEEEGEEEREKEKKNE